MAVKSVIDIEVSDEKFQHFKDLFDKYQQALAKTPNAWKAVGKENATIATQFERMAAALMAQGQISRENAHEEKEKLNRLKTTDTLWTNIRKSSGSFLKNIQDSGSFLLKWGSIIAGVSTGGALYGLDRLGAAAADQRRSSLGLGLSVGEQQAFGTNFRRFVSPDSFLSGINSAVSNVALQGPLYGIGVNPNQSVGEVAIDTLKKVRALAQATPINQLGLLESSRHLDQLGLSVEDIRRLRKASPEEFNKQIARYQGDVNSLGFNDKTGEAWQNFTDQMTRAGQEIFKTFVVGLEPLAGPLTNLSNSIVNAFQRFAEGGAAKSGIDTLADWINNFNGQVASDKFQTAVSDLVSDTSVIADSFHVLANLLRGAGYLVGGTVSTASNITSAYSNIGARNAFLKDPKVADYLKLLAEADQQFKLPAGTLERQWQIESGGKLNPANSSKGAIGAFQFLPSTAKDLGIDPHDPLQSLYGAGQYDQQLLAKYKGDIAKMLAAYNAGEGTVDKAIERSKKNHDSWVDELPQQETRDYLARAKGLGVTININNNTGGNAIVAASQQTQ